VSLSLDDRVWSIAFSPDGHTLLTGIEKGRAEFWEVATGKKKAEPLRHEKAVYAVAYSPDGRTVLTGSEDATARLWDAVTHQPLGVTLTHQGTVYAVAFQPPDGQLILTGSDDRTARLWRTATGQPIGKPLQHPARVLAVAFSPDGSLIATGCGDGWTRLWDTATGHPIGRPLFHRGPVRSVAFAHRPQSSGAREERLILVSAGEDMTARVWEVPPPLDERPEQIMLSAQVATGMRLDQEIVADSLAPAAWRQLHRQLNGESEPPIRDAAQPDGGVTNSLLP
jgi:WD40 repeat protein